MALTSITIDFDLAQILGGDFDPRRTKAYVTTNVASGTLMDTSTGETRLGDEAVSISDDGTGSFTTWAVGVDGNPESWQTSLVVDYPRTGQRDRKRRTFGPWTLTTADDGKNIVDLEEEQAVPAEYVTQVTDQLDAQVAAAQGHASAAASSADEAEAAAALARDISNIDTSDNVVTALIADENSATRAELETTLSGKADAAHTHDDRYYTESETDSLLAGKAASTHTHTIANVTGLQSALDGKQATGDYVESTDVTDIVVLTQAAYDALTPDADTLYVVVG